MKKVLRILGLGAVMAIGSAGLAACSGESGNDEGITIGVVCIGDPATSTYDANFKDALEAVKEKYAYENYNVKTMYWKAKGEGEDAKVAAEEAALECDVVILDSYGHQFFGWEVAQNNPTVKFISLTGDTAAAKQIPNFYNAFANIYEGRYLAGIAAGMKLNEYTDAKDHVLGYVAAWQYAEVISGYTAFYLGAKSVCPDVTMKTVVTKSWGDEGRETTGANKLIEAGCKVISQHADTYGAPNACNAKGIPNVSYNVAANRGNLASTYLTYTRINWEPYFNHVIECCKNVESLEYDWSKGLSEGSVVVDMKCGSCAASNTEFVMQNAADKIKDGTLNVFDCSTFTVTKDETHNPYADVDLDADGHVTGCRANVIPDDNYAPDTEVVVKGVFKESAKRSAPYFELMIDGITCIDDGAGYEG